VTGQPRVRTYNARRGRMSPLTQARLEELLPQHGIPEGPLVAEVAFGRRGPVVLDIGCGHGAAAIGYAVAHPEHDVIAVDVHSPGVARMLAAADARGVTNLWAHIGDAVAMVESRIGARSLRAVHLFFPDPWPKARHIKRRFISEQTLDLLAERLVTGGSLLVATDHASYAEHALAELQSHPAFDVSETQRPDWRPVDGFEAKGLAAGRDVTDLRAVVR
jgi:tRNA (guanine-N7-)-methyltransferase